MLTNSKKIFYSLPGLPVALVGITFYVYLPKYYVDSVGLSVGVVGFIILISRIWDAVLDPSIGYLSDKTKSIYGRRKPWILISAIPLALTFFLLCNPQLAADFMRIDIWFALWTFLFFLFWTTLTVPYEALGAELSFDYNERTSLLGAREAAVILGTLLAGLIPFIIGLETLGDSANSKFNQLGFYYGLLLIIATTLCYKNINEINWSANKTKTPFAFTTFKQALSQAPFRILISAYTIAALGAALPATLILFYVEDVLQSSHGSAFLVLYFLVGFLCLPLWIRLASKIGKKQAWITAMLVNTGAFAGVLLLSAGDELLYAVLVALSGIGYGATLALPASMQADVIDYDELQHGIRREGQFLGIWSIAKKLAAAAGAGIGLQLLSLAGYKQELVAQDDALLMLKFLYAGIPCLCNLVGIAIAFKYPLDETQYKLIRSEIDARAA